MTPGILPSALRASSAVRAAPAAQCPKVTKKARHRTRWSDSHRANRTALCFSLAPALATVHPCTALGDRDPSRSLYECSRHELRCSAPRTAPSVARKPSIHGLLRTRPLAKLALLCAADSAAGCRQRGPRLVRRRGVGKARRVARRMRASSLHAQGCAFSEPRSPFADPEGRMPGGRAIRGVFLW